MRGTSWVAVILVIAIGSAVGIAAGTFLAVYGPMFGRHGGFGQIWSPPWGGERFVRILMIGEDDTGKKRADKDGLSDTLVVMAIDTQTRQVRAISIPRDTKVDIPGHGTCKINAAHVFGGPELSKQVVRDLLGVPIDYYAVIGISGFGRGVGGVSARASGQWRRFKGAAYGLFRERSSTIGGGLPFGSLVRDL